MLFQTIMRSITLLIKSYNFRLLIFILFLEHSKITTYVDDFPLNSMAACSSVSKAVVALRNINISAEIFISCTKSEIPYRIDSCSNLQTEHTCQVDCFSRIRDQCRFDVIFVLFLQFSEISAMILPLHCSHKDAFLITYPAIKANIFDSCLPSS